MKKKKKLHLSSEAVIKTFLQTWYPSAMSMRTVLQSSLSPLQAKEPVGCARLVLGRMCTVGAGSDVHSGCLVRCA